METLLLISAILYINELMSRTLDIVAIFSEFCELERVLVMVVNWDQSSSDTNVRIYEVTPDVHFQKDLGLDSLDNVEIVMALEEEFKLEIPDKEADKIDSCNLAIEYIYNHPMAG
ncbi:acyl carrier protein 1, mitochondrial [Quercus suber]|uniref:acyl carrier protein 1, mitochondrial n=1 Tax=Quercus suber TaxID=58331 RepID=UPI0032DF7C0F